MRAKKFLQGDKSAGICAQCKAIVATTYRRRDVPFASGIGMVRDILVAICDICGSVVSTPSQSTPAIKAAYKKIIKESKLKRQRPRE
ncbi:hypothetical protein [Bordetella sp. N]|uniref:hypothetical protein n=1 Tax=Bordetella sp. N TaxID=1746199 RepID=UPI00070E1F72|nr:hypothetical protein [Bordetella sp. N]ALM83232.1 hypothetical protein ASB57_09875 [Bordetella sp. N]